MSHPEHFRESLPLFQQDSCMEVAGVANQQGAQSPVAQLPQERHVGCGRAGGIRPSPRSHKAHARKSDGPNSHKAAQSVTNLGPVRDAILDILSMGDFTDSEIEQWYSDRQKTWGYPLSSPSGLRSRRSELVTMNFVHEVGTGKTKSGRPCAIWALKERKA